MNNVINKLLHIVNNNSSVSLADKKRKVSDELEKIGLRPKIQYALMEKILKVVKITNNPKTRESLIRSYFRTHQEDIQKDGRNSSITIEITKKCNKNCDYCYSTSHGESQKIDDCVLNSIIDFAKKEYKHIFITGGEPTLDERVFTIAENNPDIMFFMFTNGSTITMEYAKRLSRYGNIIPMLSVDGSRKSLHNSLKGIGSYDEITNAIDNLNRNNVSWGYISMVTEKNARDVLNQNFIKNMRKKGAFIARYLEYLPVGSQARRDLILSNETYYLLEKRKKEIITSGDIYIQETSQNKCTGLLSFDVYGNIKNCPFFHYAKYNVVNGNLKDSIKKTMRDWISYNYAGECPLYSDPIGLKNHLEKLGWKHIFRDKEEYLNNQEVAQKMMKNYKRFLEIKAARGLS